MQPNIIRQKLHQFINTIDDKKAEAIYILLSEETDTDAQLKKLVQAEHEANLPGGSQPYSWQKQNNMAMSQERRNSL